MRIQWTLVLFLYFLLNGTGIAFSQTAPQVISPNGKQLITPIEYLFVPDSALGVDEIARLHDQGRFKVAGERILNLGIPSTFLWLRFKLKSEPGGTYMIEVGNSRINRLQLFESGPRGVARHRMNGDFYPFRERELFHKHFCFKTQFSAGDSLEYFLFIDQVGSTAQIPVWVSSEAAFKKTVQNSYLFDGLVYGILVFVSLFSIFLFVNTRHVFYIFYGLYVASGILWFFAYFGLGFEFLWSRSCRFQMLAAPLFACGNLILNLKIYETLLVTAKSRNRLIRLGNYFKIALACILLFPVFVDLRYAGFFVNHTYLLIFLSVVIATMVFLTGNIIYFVVKKALVARVYLVASLIKAGGIINLALIELNLSVDLFPVEVVLQIGIIVEISLLSYIIARRYTAYKNKTTQAIISAQEQERAVMAKEIHDHILSGLNGLLKTAEGLQYYLEDRQPPEINERVKRFRESLTGLYHQTRDISHYMMPDYIVRYNINTIAETYISHINATLETVQNPLRIHFRCEGVIRAFSQEAKLNIFRILQELITNITTHSRAATAVVCFDFRNKELVLSVADDGRGMLQSDKRGMGLLNIKSRVKLLQGRIRIHNGSEPSENGGENPSSRGITITLFIPYYLENYFNLNDY